MNSLKFLVITVILSFGLLLAGCPSKNKSSVPKFESFQGGNNPSNLKLTDIETPDLEGGPESKNRTLKHNNPFKNVLFYKGSGNVKEAALTFDDGPDSHYTPQILNILKQNNIKATFFIVGMRAHAHPEMVKRIIAEGHLIGNHTWNHPKLSKLSPEQIRNQVLKTEQELYSITGYRTAMFRPPYGAARPRAIREVVSMGYKIIDWSVDTRDWAGTPPSKIMDYVRKEINPGGIILEHCAAAKGEDLKNTVEVLPSIIKFLKAEDYKFVVLPELLHINPSKN